MLQQPSTLTANEKSTLDSLIKAGFEMDDIPALMGNIDKETGGSFNYTQLQDGGGGGYGLFQFTDSEKIKHLTAYRDWLDKSDLEDGFDSQAKFVYDNIYAAGRDVPYDIGGGNREKIRFSFDSASLPYKTFMFGKQYERFKGSQDVSVSADNYKERIDAAKKYKGMLSKYVTP